MARDVEFNVTASDRTGAALAAAERNFARTNAKIKKEQDRTSDLLGKGLLNSLSKIAPQGAADIAGMLSKGASLGGPAIAAAVAAVAPVIGATVSAAVIGGVGLGGVLGGVALAAKDPRVAGAGKVLGGTLKQGLTEAADGFIDPVLRSIDQVEDRFEKLQPRLESIFDKSAGFLEPLVTGALEAVDAITVGIDNLLSDAGPVMDALGEGFAEVGRAIGEALTIIGEGGDDAALALKFVFSVIAESIVITARFVRLLTETYGALAAVQGTINNVLPFLDLLGDKNERVGGSGTFAADGARAAADGMNAERAASAELSFSLEQAEAAVNDVYQANLNLYSSTTNVAEAMANARKQIAENGRTLSLNSEKGRENRDALASVAGALQRQYDGFVKVNGVGPRSAAVAEDLRGKFVALAQKAGLSAAAAQELAGKILNIPSKRETKISAATAEAKADIAAVKARMDGLKNRTVTVTVRVNASQIAKVNNQLDRAGANNFTAGDYWSATGGRGAVSRVGGPAAVNVTSDVTVQLDGQPFYAVAVTAAERTANRAAWRQKVGPR